MTYPLVRPRYYLLLYRDIIAFLRRPHPERRKDKSVRLKIYDTIGLNILKFVALVPVVLFFAVVYDPENVQSISMAERFSPVMLLLMGGLVLPFFEEIGFRLSLVFRPIYLAMTFSVLTYYFLTKAVFHTNISLVDDSFPLRLGLSIMMGLIAFPVLHHKTVSERLQAFWVANFRTVFYLACVVFAWMHITKYEVNLVNVMLLPILTLPQLLSAIIYGYTRVAFGFRYPVFLHMAMNSAIISLSLLTA